MKKFLVPTDFSENARNALVAALNLATVMKAEVLLCSIYDQPSSGQSVLRNLSEQLRANTLEDLRTEIEEVCGTFGNVPISPLAVQGDVAEMIVKTANFENADLIVMGKAGKSNFSNLIFGSVALQTIHLAEKPLLMIPQEWQYKPFSKVCLATDLSPQNYSEILAPMINFAEVFKATIELLHFAEDQEALEEIYNGGGAVKKEIEEVLADKPHKFSFRIEENVKKALFQHLDNSHFHMMCMVKNEYNWVQRLFRKTPIIDAAIHTHVPLLILH